MLFEENREKSARMVELHQSIYAYIVHETSHLIFTHLGLLTPEPDEGLLNSALSPGEAAQGCSSSLSQMIGGRQSRVDQLSHVGSFMPRVPTPRPSEAGIIMVKPYQGEKRERSQQ